MDDLFDNMEKAIKHLMVLHNIFNKMSNFSKEDLVDYEIYKGNLENLRGDINELEFSNQIYSAKGRQMILADLFEYILIGRGYYSLKPKSKEDRERFVRLILHFVNLLMCYEVMTVSDNLRSRALRKLGEEIPDFEHEDYYSELREFIGTVGLPKEETEAPKYLNGYFDSLLPKTAGGLWHELLVYIFLLRADIGYIIPLLLSQRLIGTNDTLIPPDFLIITHDKNLYGIEVGIKKEIQSGSFSLQTNIPTATIDTINSRSSDRCPICKKWIPFCDFVIKNYSDFDTIIEDWEIRCLETCNIFPRENIAKGDCPYTKYSRGKAKTLKYARHSYATGLHYHYRCVLNNVAARDKSAIITTQDTSALKTHYPYYSGLEALMRKSP